MPTPLPNVPDRPIFEVWMKQVDFEISRRCGMIALDLPDQPYRDWYDDGYEPSEAAEEAIRNAMD